MSSEFERLLRQARKALPKPYDEATRRAREKAVAAVAHPRRLRLRSPLGLAAALAAAIALGVAVGALATPSGSAADGPTGLGFLPAEGWSVYQAGTRATFARPASAIATNVPLSPEDFVDGRPDPSQLPYSTLLALPRNGVVIVADFTLLREHTVLTGKLFRPGELPLSLRHAAPDDEYGTQIRPGRPLGQYQLRTAIKGYAVDLRFYFGTARPSQALVAATERQLERLVVAPVEPRARTEPPRILEFAPTAASGGGASRIVDRTLRCDVALSGGIPKIEVSVAAGARQGKRFKWIAQATFTTFDQTQFGEDHYLHMAGFSAGWPPPPGLRSGGLSISLERCTPTVGRPALTPRGLVGGPVDAFEDKYECFPPKTIVLRMRAVFRRPTALHIDRRGERSLSAMARIMKGSVVAQTRTGRRIAYAEVFDSGKARLFTAGDCVPDSS
jgi:hypothetical protein